MVVSFGAGPKEAAKFFQIPLTFLLPFADITGRQEVLRILKIPLDGHFGGP